MPDRVGQVQASRWRAVLGRAGRHARVCCSCRPHQLRGGSQATARGITGRRRTRRLPGTVAPMGVFYPITHPMTSRWVALSPAGEDHGGCGGHWAHSGPTKKRPSSWREAAVDDGSIAGGMSLCKTVAGNTSRSAQLAPTRPVCFIASDHPREASQISLDLSYPTTAVGHYVKLRTM